MHGEVPMAPLDSSAPPPTPEGPRERALEEGVACLGDADLITILLGTGLAGRPAALVAVALLERFAGVPGIARFGAAALAEHPGVGVAKALRILAGIELGKRALRHPLALLGPVTNSRSVAAHLLPMIGSIPHEEMWLLSLDGRNYARTLRRVAQGGLHSAAVSPRDILRAALADAASAMVLVHNHPSGDPEPSSHDVVVTRQLQQAGEMVGIPLVDHVILCPSGKHTSMLDLGILSPIG